jgi:catechol 2,3-dioxygenase-like lactoylglutathione lyase family enzyme
MTRPPFSQQITFLNTDNLEETADFYEEILELPLALDQGTCRIYQASSDSYLGFCLNIGASECSPGIILTLVTQEVDDWYHHLSERGVQFEKPPTFNKKYQIYHCFLRDPNGYLVEIQRFDDPRWLSDTSTPFDSVEAGAAAET